MSRAVRITLVACLAACSCGQGVGDDPDFASGSDDDDDESSTAGEGSESSDESGGDDGSVKYDVDGDSDGSGPCGCGSQLEFSYIWIANSPESTVTKLNTVSMVEEGRYLTRGDGAGDPSRTSVSLSGRAVAIANRNGGVTKIWAQPELCDPMRNGDPGVQTSTGKDDVLPWGRDDCVAWHTPLPHASNRPIAYAGGVLDEGTCEYVGEKVWTSGCSKDFDANAWVHRLDGATGEVEDTIEIPGLACLGAGAYGGAVDGDGNFWVSDSNQPTHIARIDSDSLEVQVWESPLAAYGITVDHTGRPWLSAQLHGSATAARFDPVTETWALADNQVATGFSGIQEDAHGRMWLPYHGYGVPYGPDGITWIDVETMQVGPRIEWGLSFPKGIAIDLAGNVWVVEWGSRAFRYDPETQQLDSYDQLSSAYTYSDMTGWALQNASCDPAG